MPNKFGWIKIHRKLMDSDIWLCDRFTKGQAWVDLLMLCQSQTNGIYKAGDVHESQQALSVRWRWSIAQVRSFTDELEKLGMAKVKRTNKGTTITICNWQRYQITDNSKSTDTESQTIEQNEKKVEIYYDENGERRRRYVSEQPK